MGHLDSCATVKPDTHKDKEDLAHRDQPRGPQRQSWSIVLRTNDSVCGVETGPMHPTTHVGGSPHGV